ncbi:tlde protein, part of tlde/tldd proteolytic complex [hydrocarbon metagenome]|uniref:Tlde protein, part of tlde/tldd proteolytic complex n=1 Tax=hydrocarbon metagenome TaxID=938273 RepID=A0A0W8E8R7_9ZZZZ
MEQILRSAGEKTLDEARRSGVEAEAFLMHAKELSIEIVDGRVETLKQADETGLGIRLIKDGRTGFAFTSDLSDKAIKDAVQDAISISIFTTQDQYQVLPDKAVYPEIQVFDQDTAAMSLEEKIEIARSVERSAKSVDLRVAIIERSGYDDLEYCNLIMNSKGLYAYETGNFSGIYIFLVAEEGNDAQNGFSTMSVRKAKDLSAAQVGKEAAANAIRALNARTIRSGKMPIILEPYVATRFAGIVSSMVNAEAVQKGKSMFAGKIGKQVASSLCTIIDDAILEEGIASSSFDSEGVPAQKKILIENGILNTYLHNTYTARKDGVLSTGNAQRGSFRGLPMVGSTNFIIVPGRENKDSLIDGIDKGLYVTEVMGMHTANPISGDFSVGAAGIMIENGVLTYPVRGVTIAGNVAEFLQNIDAVASDFRFYGGKGSPSIRIRELSIAGE